MTKLLLTFAILGLTVAQAASYRVTLFQPSLVGNTELRPGEYRLELTENKVVLSKAGASVEANVKVESAESKFNSTSVRYQNGDGKYRIQEIRLGGTKTKLVFN
jgi:hypothetical protein